MYVQNGKKATTQASSAMMITGGDKPGVDTVTIKEVPEAGARTAMLQTGEADFIYPTPSDQIEAIKGTDDVNILTTDSNIMRYVTLNMDLEQLSECKSTSGYELCD